MIENNLINNNILTCDFKNKVYSKIEVKYIIIIMIIIIIIMITYNNIINIKYF
jgi:hypothetical protein